MKFLDLSVMLRKGSLSLPPGHPDFELKDIRFHDKDFKSVSFLQMSTHGGTHVDAPYHYIKVCFLLFYPRCYYSTNLFCCICCFKHCRIRMACNWISGLAAGSCSLYSPYYVYV